MKAEEMRAGYAVMMQPKNGAVVPFDKVTEPKIDQGGPLAAGEFIYVDISSVDNKLKRITEYKTLAVETAPGRAKQRLKSGDVLISMTRPNLNAVAIVPPELDGAVGSTGFHVLRATEGTESRWLYYAVQTKDFISAMSELVQGALYPAVRPKDIRAYEIPHPPLDQQKRIVAEIEKQFSRLDEAVTNLKRAKANLKRYKAAVLKAAVEGRLVEIEAERARREGRSYETGAQLLQRILETRRSQWRGKGKYKEPAAPDITDLPELPEGWVWASPDQLAESADNSICAGPFGTIFKAKDFRPSGVPIIFLRHVAPGRYLNHKPGFMDVTKWQELFQPYSVYGGELLITKLGEPPGVCAIYPGGGGPAMVTPDVIKLSVNSDVVLPRYLMHYFNSETARRFSTGAAFGTTRLRLTIPIFRGMPVPIPPFKEQQEIVAEIDRSLSLADEAEAQANTNLKRSEILRRAVLQRSFRSPVSA